MSKKKNKPVSYKIKRPHKALMVARKTATPNEPEEVMVKDMRPGANTPDINAPLARKRIAEVEAKAKLRLAARSAAELKEKNESYFNYEEN